MNCLTQLLYTEQYQYEGVKGDNANYINTTAVTTRLTIAADKTKTATEETNYYDTFGSAHKDKAYGTAAQH